MTEKQKVLYEYLLAKGDEYIPQVQVARDLYEHFGNGECCLAPDEFHNTTERSNLTHTISEINSSPEFPKIIISGKKGIKIANEEEHHRFVARQYGAIFRKLKRAYIMERKGNANGQITIDGRTIEAYLRGVDAEINNF
jgi:hypothetical protein